MVDRLIDALALLLVLEGLMPFLNPAGWRRFVERLGQLSDGQIRFFGLSVMVAGALLLVATA